MLREKKRLEELTNTVMEEVIKPCAQVDFKPSMTVFDVRDPATTN